MSTVQAWGAFQPTMNTCKAFCKRRIVPWSVTRTPSNNESTSFMIPWWGCTAHAVPVGLRAGDRGGHVTGGRQRLLSPDPTLRQPPLRTGLWTSCGGARHPVSCHAIAGTVGVWTRRSCGLPSRGCVCCVAAVWPAPGRCAATPPTLTWAKPRDSLGRGSARELSRSSALV